MDNTTLLIIILIVVILLGGGWYGRGRWFYEGLNYQRQGAASAVLCHRERAGGFLLASGWHLYSRRKGASERNTVGPPLTLGSLAPLAEAPNVRHQGFSDPLASEACLVSRSSNS